MTTSKEVILISDEENDLEESKINEAMPLLEEVRIIFDKDEQEKSKIIEALTLSNNVSILTFIFMTAFNVSFRHQKTRSRSHPCLTIY